MILDELNEKQREQLYKAFNNAKSESGRERVIKRHTKDFAEHFGKRANKTKFDIERSYTEWERKIRGTLTKAHATKENYYRHIGKTPPLVEKKSAYIVQLMDDIGYKSKDREKIAEELQKRGKDFLPLLIEKIQETSKYDFEISKQDELDILRKREYEIAEILSPISNFSVLKGFDSFHSWKRVLWLKLAYTDYLKEEAEKATGAIRTALNDIIKRIDIKDELSLLIHHIEINSFADRLLSQYYMNENFEKLEDEHLKLCVGLAYSQTKEFSQNYEILFSHNSVFDMEKRKEIVFRKEDNYVKDYHANYSHKQPTIKKIIEIGAEGEAKLKKLVKKIEKKLEGRKITYLWQQYFTKSIEIPQEFINDHTLANNELALNDDMDRFENLYSFLNISSDIIKAYTHNAYRKGKK